MAGPVGTALDSCDFAYALPHINRAFCPPLAHLQSLSTPAATEGGWGPPSSQYPPPRPSSSLSPPHLHDVPAQAPTHYIALCLCHSPSPPPSVCIASWPLAPKSWPLPPFPPPSLPRPSPDLSSPLLSPLPFPHPHLSVFFLLPLPSLPRLAAIVRHSPLLLTPAVNCLWVSDNAVPFTCGSPQLP